MSIAEEHEAPANARPAASRFEAFARVCIVAWGPVMASILTVPLLPALPLMARHFAVGAPGAGFMGLSGGLVAQLIVTIPSLVMMFSAPLVTLAAGWLGKRRILLGALVVFALAGLGDMVLYGPLPFLASRVIVGLAGGVIYTLYLSFAADFFAHNARRKVIGFAVFCSLVASLLELVAGGWLVDHYGWRTPFVFHALAVPVLAIAWAGVFPSDEVRTERRSTAPKIAAIAPLTPFYLLLLVFAVGMFTLSLQGPFLLTSKGVTRATEQGFILAGWSLTAALSAICFARLRQLVSDAALVAAIGLVMGTGLITAAKAGSTPILVLGMLVVGLGKGFVAPTLESMIMNRAQLQVRVMAAGLVVSAMFLGQFLTPIICNALGRSGGIEDAVESIGAIVGVAGVAAAIILAARRLNVRTLLRRS